MPVVFRAPFVELFVSLLLLVLVRPTVAPWYRISEARGVKFSDTVSIFVHTRNYLTGPIEDQYAIYTHDAIGAYVGPFNPDYPVAASKPNTDTYSEERQDTQSVIGTIRSWAMIGLNADGYHSCELQAVHDFGEYAFFICPKPGVYRIFAYDKVAGDSDGPFELPLARASKFGDRPIWSWYTLDARKAFDLFAIHTSETFAGSFYQSSGGNKDTTTEVELTEDERFRLLRTAFLRLNSKTDPAEGKLVLASSDPIYVEESTNCYYWMYKIADAAKGGYSTFDNIDLKVDKGEAYVHINLLIWIAEPVAVGIDEASLALTRSEQGGSSPISEYSKMLTRRYYTLGLFPCLRKAHSAIEITDDIKFVLETDQGNDLKSPHWKASLKIHTDRLVTTISDVSFTIAGRQNAALFGCFVGDTRVFVNTKTFEFVKRERLSERSIQLRYSKIEDAFTQKLSNQIAPVFGHGVQYIGNIKSMFYEPSTSRTDMVIVNNPCIIQEFAISMGGSLYVAEGMIAQGMHQLRKVYLPGLEDLTEKNKKEEQNRLYLRITDVAFTPTHFVILLHSGIVILHPTSIERQGLGRMSNTQKYRSNAFVKRRWCGRTSTPKLSNMIVPAFSFKGSIIIIQIYPIEGSVHMWVSAPSQFCLPEGHQFVRKAKELREEIKEKDIHFNEWVAVSRSDDRGIRIPTPPPRPELPKKTHDGDRDQELTFLINNGSFVEHGGDPHFPPELANPASQTIGDNLENYNAAVIYTLNKDDADQQYEEIATARNKFLTILRESQDSGKGSDGSIRMELQAVEFTALEKQFLVGTKFSSKTIESILAGDGGLAMMITTMTVTNLPSEVHVPDEARPQDEVLETVVPFPGVYLIRSKVFQANVTSSRDPLENQDISSDSSKTKDFLTKIYPISTSLPSYLVNFGDVLLFTSLDGRYARPLYYFDWCALDGITNPLLHSRPAKADAHPCIEIFKQNPPNPRPTEDEVALPDRTKIPRIYFNRSSPLFNKETLYDVAVTAEGIISVLWRKEQKHLIQDDEVCLITEDSSNPQSVAIGSVLLNDGLREIRPFFHNDNIFQMATPDGEIVYGKYDVRPHSPFADCPNTTDTSAIPEICIQQPNSSLPGQPKKIYVCSLDRQDTVEPCRDPGYLKYCPQDLSAALPSGDACLRVNNVSSSGSGASLCSADNDKRFEEVGYKPPKAKAPADRTRRRRQVDNDTTKQVDPTHQNECYTDTEDKVTDCWPDHAPREELREISLLGTSFYGYLHGSLKSIKSVHPEAPIPEPGDYVEEEPDVCPFVGFNVHNVDFDFAEVGYETRITGEISFLGKGIPTEADLLVDFEPTMGVTVELSSSVEESRDLTTIRKIIDVTFVLTDFQLEEIRNAQLDFANEDFYKIRAREKSSTFSLTLRPSIINMYCKNKDYFKTVQFSVGCNTFSELRLISEAAPFHQVNLTEMQKATDDFKWEVDGKTLIIPKAHVHRLQAKESVFNCSLQDNTKCLIPYFELFKDEIFTTSYRDFFHPHFEQFLTVFTRRVSGNMIIYDLLGSSDFNVSVNNLQAGCYSTGKNWYHVLLNSTNFIFLGSSEHEYIYTYYVDCFNDSIPSEREQSQTLDSTPFYLFNQTNGNEIKFRRQRNQIFIFRAVVLNTEYNRFTYCRTLETFFMVRITGIPIPRQGIPAWLYLTIVIVVVSSLLITYLIFFQFYTWKLDSTNPMPSEEGEENN